jgi:peptidoglycan L-alanyl-D-glutamate endopeptidase CwlK
MDKITASRIEKLHPLVREEVTSIVNEINQKLTGRAKFRITQGLRTFAEQDALFAKRPRVTKAKGGQSVHNYGFAVDGVLIIDGKVASWDFKKDWDADGVADWDECVKVFAKYGWSWGGNWNNFKDFPHFDKIGFNNWRILAAKKRDKNNYIII